ncbi:MAG: hypothetical protein ACOCWY_05435 [Thermodesulfobacteriota bacterium]
MKRILRLEGSGFDEMMNSGLALRYCMVNVAILGLVYGGSAIHLSKRLLTQGTINTLSFNPIFILTAGVGLAFLMHGGIALFIWVFCRGAGGCRQFMPPYLNIGAASIALWPLAPALAAYQIVRPGVFLIAYMILFAIYGGMVEYVGVHRASGLSTLKMAIVAVVTVIYIGCFLYLWIG